MDVTPSCLLFNFIIAKVTFLAFSSIFLFKSTAFIHMDEDGRVEFICSVAQYGNSTSTISAIDELVIDIVKI